MAHCLIYPVDPGLCVQRPFVKTEALLYRYIRSVLSTKRIGQQHAGLEKLSATDGEYSELIRLTNV